MLKNKKEKYFLKKNKNGENPKGEKMKKIIFGLVAVLAFNVMAAETFLGAGYDFHRSGSNAKLSGSKKFDGNGKVRAEWLPFSGEKFKAGVGIAHDFGTKSNDVKLGSATPVYVVFKPEWELNSDWKFYNKYRLGWSFNANKSNHKSGTYALDSSYKSGPMAGAEVGFEYKKVAFGLVYDADFIPGKAAQNSGTVNHQLGVQVGYVFGGAEKAKPYIPAPKPVEVPVVEVPAPPVVEEPAPVVKERQENGRAIVRFQFDHPQVDLQSERNVLNQTIDFLNKAKYVDVDVTGHTDSKGSEAYNEKLGQKRADNVANELRAKTDPSKVRINSVVGKGETEPVATNATEAGRAENRRVEIDFRGWFDQEETRY